MNDIKTCPFCGGKAKIVDTFVGYIVVCIAYDKLKNGKYATKHSIEVGPFKTEQEAIKEWNKRN